MQELIIASANLEICVQTFGLNSNPAILFIYGAAGQGILWDLELCQKLANNGYFVIRFDNRDTGKSSVIDFNLNPYNLDDLTNDLNLIINHFALKKIHLVGSSMGGYIAQIFSSKYPEKLASLTLMMTTINSSSLRGINGELPSHSSYFVKELSRLYEIPRSTLAERILALTNTWKLFSGWESEFPFEQWHELAKESYQRAKGNNAIKNHRLAILNSAPDRTNLMNKISTPTLIIHGAADPVIQVEHALYAAKQISHASLKIIDKMGHLLISQFTNQVLDELHEHFQTSSKN